MLFGLDLAGEDRASLTAQAYSIVGISDPMQSSATNLLRVETDPLPRCWTNLVRCWTNSALRNAAQLRSNGHRSSSARLINEMPGRRPLNVAAIPSRTGIALKEHRHDIRVNDSGIHREGAGAEPSWRHARSMAEKSSTDSSSADGCPSRVSNSVTGQTPCDAASSSNEGVSEFRLIALLVSLSTVSR